MAYFCPTLANNLSTAELKDVINDILAWSEDKSLCHLLFLFVDFFFLFTPPSSFCVCQDVFFFPKDTVTVSTVIYFQLCVSLSLSSKIKWYIIFFKSTGQPLRSVDQVVKYWKQNYQPPFAPTPVIDCYGAKKRFDGVLKKSCELQSQCVWKKKEFPLPKPVEIVLFPPSLQRQQIVYA